jgi:Type II secretory pathway, component PulF
MTQLYDITLRKGNRAVTERREYPSEHLAWRSWRDGWTVTSVVPADESPEIATGKNSKKKGLIRGKRMIRFCKTVGAMLRGQMKLETALELYARRLEDADLANVLNEVVRKITKQGERPHVAFEQTGRFDPQFIAIVKAADQASSMGRGLRKLADRMEKSQNLAKSLFAELSIPGLAAILGTVGFVVLQFGAVRTMEQLSEALRVDPGTIMGTVFAIGRFTRQTWPIFAIAFIGTVIFFWLMPMAREQVLAFLMGKIKTLRDMILGMRQLTIMGTMDLLLNCYGPNSGLGMTAALKAATDVSEGTQYHEELKRVTTLYTREGVSLGNALETNSSFDPQITQLLGIGEETNSAGDQVANICEMYDELTSDAMARFKMTAYLGVLIYVVCLVVLIAAGVVFPSIILGPKMITPNAGSGIG